MTNKDYETATHCFYNEEDNLWCEYQFDTDMGMYIYEIYSPNGFEYRGYVGSKAIAEKAEAWEFVGVL